MATRFVRWAQAHPVLLGVLIVLFYAGAISQDRPWRSFVIATVVLGMIAGLLVARVRVERRQ